jgi:hypothetical protein
MSLRSRFALRLVAAIALCAPFAACDDKKSTIRNPPTRDTWDRPAAPSGQAPQQADPFSRKRD